MGVMGVLVIITITACEIIKQGDMSVVTAQCFLSQYCENSFMGNCLLLPWKYLFVGKCLLSLLYGSTLVNAAETCTP